MFELQTEIDINAPAEEVWNIITGELSVYGGCIKPSLQSCDFSFLLSFEKEERREGSDYCLYEENVGLSQCNDSTKEPLDNKGSRRMGKNIFSGKSPIVNGFLKE